MSELATMLDPNYRMTFKDRMAQLADQFGLTGMLTSPDAGPSAFAEQSQVWDAPYDAKVRARAELDRGPVRDTNAHANTFLNNMSEGLANALVLPGHAAGGGKWTNDDVTDMALELAKRLRERDFVAKGGI